MQQWISGARGGLLVCVCGLTVIVSAGCSKPADDQPNAAALLGAKIARTAATQPSERIDLAQLTDFDWDRLYIFGPHTKRDEVQNALGYEWAGVSKTKIARSDEISLLVFTKDRKVVGWLEYLRLKADFSFVSSSTGYTRDEARFAIRAEKPWPVVAQTRASAQ
jgi:hypothetical protein